MRRFLRVAGPTVVFPLVAGAAVVACFNRLGDDPVFLRDGGIVVGDTFVPFDAPTSGDAGPGQDATNDAPGGPGKIQGTVYDFFMADRGVVAGADVSVAGLPAVKTDANGRFTIDNVPAGDRVLVNVSYTPAAGDTKHYSSTQVPVKVRSNATSVVNPRLQQGCSDTRTIDGDAGVLTVPIVECYLGESYASILFESDAIATANNARFTGTMRVEILPITFPLGTNSKPELVGFRSLPGDMGAVRANNQVVVLESVGAVEIRIVDDATNAPLKIGTGKTATIDVGVYRAQAAGETFVSWSYETARGIWVEQSGGLILSTEGGQAYFETTVSQLGWWNVDVPRANTCVKGTLTLGGKAVVGAVGAIGVDYAQSSAPTSTSGDGTFCRDVRAGSQIAITGEHSALPSFDSYAARATVATGSGTHSCFLDPTMCQDIGTLALAPRDPGCAKGTLKRNVPVDGGGTALEPITKPISVYAYVPLSQSELGSGWIDRVYVGKVTPGSDGSFCLSLPAGTEYDFSDDDGSACERPATMGAFQRAVVTIPPAAGTFCGAQPDGGGAGACADLGEIDVDCFYSYGQ